MKKILINTIYKYFNIRIIDENKNLLEIPIPIEYWLYIIRELEDDFKLPIISVLETMQYDDFTLNELNKRLMLIS